MKKSLIAILLIFTLILTALSSCGIRNGGGITTDPNQENSTEPSEATSEQSKSEDEETKEDTKSEHVCAFSEWSTVIAATCTDAGEQERVCECGKKETQVLAANGHNEVIDEAVIPTYDNTGLSEGKHCSVCGTVIVEQVITGPLVKDEYTIRYMCDMVPLDSNGVPVTIPDDTYKPTETKTLYSPKMDTYKFLGWSDKDGKMYGLEIPKGMAQDLVLYANWASDRNKAEPVAQLGSPIICEDSSAGQIFFVYEIGTIKNIPLFETQNLLVINGIITSTGVVKQTAISKSNAEEIGKIIANTTTNSSTWTFSKDWNEVMSVSEEWAKQQGMTVEEAQKFCQSSSNTYNVVNSVGGSDSLIKSDDSVFKITGNKSHTESTYSDEQRYAGLSIDGKFANSTTISAGVSAGIVMPIGPAIAGGEAELKGSNTTSFEIGAGYDQQKYTQDIKTGTDSWNNGFDYTNSQSTLSTQEKSWNTTSGFTSSSSMSSSQSVSKAISEIISSKNSKDSSYSTGGESGEAKEYANSNAKEDKYSSSVVYSNEEIEISERQFQSVGNTYGAYRLVQTGTAKVFAVVAYDIKTATYCVYTYSVLDDDEYKEYLDYSYDRTFNDYETSTLPFEIPIFVNDYVNSRILSSKLQVSDDGIVTKYLGSADDEIVLIPSYYTRKNSTTGETEVIKVTGLASGLFKNNTNIKGVSLGNFINEIPESAFEGCTSLQEIICPNVVRIGANAFKGCSSLGEFSLPNEIEYIGSHAFDGISSLKSNAPTIEIANTVASSNVQNIVLNISCIDEEDFSDMVLDVGDNASFKLIGGYKSYKGLSIKSKAANTVISGITIPESKAVPLDISSSNLTLERVSVSCDGFALVLRSEMTEISVEGVSKMQSKTDNIIISKGIDIKQINEETYSAIETDDFILVCGDVEDSDGFFTVDKIKKITNEEYNSYLVSKTITFNPSGGTVSQSEKVVTFGGTYGALPVPVKTGYTFLGWYTDLNDGYAVESSHIVETMGNQTLYARWSIDTYAISWIDVENATITVTRTASPNANASIGNILSDDTVYFGDVLSITYGADDGFAISTKGETTITVMSNITSQDIFVTVIPEVCTYNIVYKSSNGTILGNATATYAYGSTNNIVPVDFAGYNTPESQSVAWDSVYEKTIIFTYTPQIVSKQTLKNNAWWWKHSSNVGLKYTVSVEVSNRTADSVTVKITWTNTIVNGCYGYGQYFNMSIGGISTGKQTIATATKWPYSETACYNGSAAKTVTITITGLDATTTVLPYTVIPSAQNNAACPDSFSGNITIPTY